MLANDLEWAQVDLFSETTWSEINALYAGGPCGAGSLKGFELLGWTWASIGDLNALFNSYLIAAGITGDDLLHPAEQDRLFDSNATTWAPAFFADGWRYIFCDCALLETGGWTSEIDPTGRFANIGDATLGVPANSFDNFSTNARFAANVFRSSRIGSWFYRSPVVVPTPNSIALVALGFVFLVLRRRDCRVKGSAFKWSSRSARARGHGGA